MNKIVITEELFLVDNLKGIVDECKDKLKLTCRGTNTLIFNNLLVTDLEINLLDNSSLDIYLYNDKRKFNRSVLIKQNNNTKINYYEACTSEEEINEDIKNILLGNNNESYVKLNVISYKEKVNISALAIGEKLTKDNIITEDIKGINHGGSIIIKPNMEISTHDISANHLVTIGPIPQSYLFYLMSKKISKVSAERLILNGFIIGTFPKYREILFGGEDNE